jgi:hypothetical protein
MEPVEMTMGLVALLGVAAIYFWIVRRSGQEALQQQEVLQQH